MGSISSSGSFERIINIQGDGQLASLKRLIIEGLNVGGGEEKTLPTLLLYDVTGLQIFEEITYLDEYYLTGQEIEILERNAGEIAAMIPDDSIVLELGSGNLRKVKILLEALEKAKRNVTYYALDLMRSELERTLAAVPEGTFKHVKCFGLHGTYDDGLEWLKGAEIKNQPKTIMSLGSSIGNYKRNDAVGFVRQFADVLGPDDTLLFGIDACQDADRVYRAYNDSHGVTNRFTINGLKHANEILGYTAFDLDIWTAVGEYNALTGIHQAYVVPTMDCVVAGIAVRRGEKVRIEESVKYSSRQAQKLWDSACVIEKSVWTNTAGDYSLHMLNRPSLMFPTKPEEYAAHPVPSLDDWQRLWKVWSTVTLQMISGEQLNEKPIKLRNACVFYLGHIPTFIAMKLSEATGTPPIEPVAYHKVFERGIDPDVDNPSLCHAHSEVPDEWPPLEEILDYQERVHARVTSLYENGMAYNDAWTGRVLWLGYEHEAMHLETLLYMLLQSDKTLPPAGHPRPNFEKLAIKAQRDAVENEWFNIPAQTVKLGLDDPDNAAGPLRHFGWDIEKPAREVSVNAFKAKGRPITNGEYAKYLSETGKNQIPASWVSTGTDNGVNGSSNGHAEGRNSEHKLSALIQGKKIRTVYGAVPLAYALEWPVSASYDELAGCAAYMGGRIPTHAEISSIYSHADALSKKQPPVDGATIPAVNGHLINEGVQESPPSKPSVNGSVSDKAGLNPYDLFVNLGEANVGFKHWHPVPVTQKGGTLASQGSMGGVWEWTSSALEKQNEYEPMKLYPAYSSDFFDGKHNIVLGGSWATHPRMAGRKSFVNWYQRNYPYAWAGARLVKDA